MRRAYNPKWLTNTGGDVLGIALGSDFCAEHEWGIDGIKYRLGLDATKDGVERRIMRVVPKELRLVDHDGCRAIFLSSTEKHYAQPEDLLKRPDFKRHGSEPLITAWDERDFAIVAHEPPDKKKLATLWEAFQTKDVAIWPNVGVFHTGGGLIFVIVSRMPKEDCDTMLKADLSDRRLVAAAERTGIAEKLKAAGRGYFALSPRWADKSETAIRWWLNPMNQEANRYGWYDLKALEEWAQGRGPVVKKGGARP